ncbi:MAG: cellulose biosynthesis protein BcsG, partial [Elusimicrobiaceae bacterium]
VCSLSWSDIKDAKVDALPFLNKFNYVFTDFSAACSYSGPSALRVLKSSCGQLPHPLLYADSPPGCYLMDNLRAAGYKAYTMFNHDGKYADFRSSVPKYGHAEPPIDISDLPVTTRMFDDSPMSADAAVLRKFWRLRSASNEPRAVLYYNTANLHIGAHNTGEPRNPDDIAAYGERLRTMFAQFEEFFEVIKKSGRNAVIVLIPEHGAALTGTKMQPKDVREIPLPAISVLPMAVKLIGKSFPRENTKTQIITKPASLQALAWLLAEFLKENPYEASAPSPEKIAAEIPVTEFAAENENAAVLKVGFGYIYKQKGGHWAPLPASVYITPGTIPSAEDFSR